MQPTYYERVLADEQLNLAATLDQDIAQLEAAGPLVPVTEGARLNDCRGRYVRAAVSHFKRALTGSMSAQQFERFQQTPAFHEALVQKASEQYWVYETFLYLRKCGERTLHVGSAAARELLAAPLEQYGYDFRLEVPATMLVFDSPEMVDALYAGDRRAGPGRHHQEAEVCVLALEVCPDATAAVRYLRVLSVHGDSERDYRVEVRKLYLDDGLALEEILESDDGNQWHGGEEVEQLIGLPASHLRWARRKVDCGFYAAKAPYYRAILAALHCARTRPERLLSRPRSMEAGPRVSSLDYCELVPAAA